MNALFYRNNDKARAAHNVYAAAQKKPKRNNLEEPDSYGNTPLLKACYQGNTEQVMTLIRAGANLKALNYFGQNALTLAAYSGNCELVQLLLRYRSYADFNNSSIVPAICVAALRQDNKMIQYFRSLDRTTDIKTSHGLRPDDIYSMLQRRPNNYAPKATHFRIF